jgi:predicted DNA-binding ribbon-helix-helix protein
MYLKLGALCCLSFWLTGCCDCAGAHNFGQQVPIRLDDFTWLLLGEIAAREGVTIGQLCAHIAAAKPPRLSFTAAIRLAVLQYYRDDGATDHGHLARRH